MNYRVLRRVTALPRRYSGWIWRQLQAIKQSGIAILLIDKHVDEFIDIADVHCIMEKGTVVWCGDSGRLTADGALKARYLGV